MFFLQGEYLKARYKRLKTQDSRDDEAGPSISKLQSSSHLKKQQERFRSALVNIILWVSLSLNNVLFLFDKWIKFLNNLKCSRLQSKRKFVNGYELHRWV